MAGFTRPDFDPRRLAPRRPDGPPPSRAVGDNRVGAWLVVLGGVAVWGFLMWFFVCWASPRESEDRENYRACRRGLNLCAQGDVEGCRVAASRCYDLDDRREARDRMFWISQGGERR